LKNALTFSSTKFIFIIDISYIILTLFREAYNLMPLTLSGRGMPGAIKRIGGSDETKKRLEAMGFTVGSNVTVVSAFGEDLIVNIKDVRVAISKEIANRIFI
jgi:ferrous iron transport protein A